MASNEFAIGCKIYYYNYGLGCRLIFVSEITIRYLQIIFYF